jgi:hypothetical protein
MPFLILSLGIWTWEITQQFVYDPRDPAPEAPFYPQAVSELGRYEILRIAFTPISLDEISRRSQAPISPSGLLRACNIAGLTYGPTRLKVVPYQTQRM